MLLQGNCLNLLTKEIMDKVDIIITDLPYGITNNKIDTPLDLIKMWEIIGDKPFITTSQQPFTTDLINSNRKGFKYIVYWNKILKTNFLNAKKQPLRQVEEIVFFNIKNYYPQMEQGKPLHSAKGKSTAKLINNNYNKFKLNESNKFSTMKYPSNLISIQKPKSAKNKPLHHPTEKPVKLMDWIISNYTQKGNVILDLCMGSGTTGVSATKLERKFIGIEKDKGLFNIAKNRVA